MPNIKQTFERRIKTTIQRSFKKFGGILPVKQFIVVKDSVCSELSYKIRYTRTLFILREILLLLSGTRRKDKASEN